MKKVGVNAFISYLKTKKVLIVSSRDFLVNYLCNTEEDGTIIDVVSSDEVDFDFPEVANTIRGATPINGILIKPDPSDSNKCTLYQCSEIDLKGIPDWALKQAFTDQAKAIALIRKQFPKWKNKYPNDNY